jgi:hypothetical protein
MRDSGLAQQGESGLHDPKSRFQVLPFGAGDRVFAAVVRAKQLLGTIEEVDTHRPDPTSNGDVDPWDAVTSEWVSLKERLRHTYQDLASEDGPTEEEIRNALATLAGAWDQVAASFSAAMADPETRAQLKKAAGSLAAALGATVTGLGQELESRDDADDEPTDHGG